MKNRKFIFKQVRVELTQSILDNEIAPPHPKLGSSITQFPLTCLQLPLIPRVEMTVSNSNHLKRVIHLSSPSFLPVKYGEIEKKNKYE